MWKILTGYILASKFHFQQADDEGTQITKNDIQFLWARVNSSVVYMYLICEVW